MPEFASRVDFFKDMIAAGLSPVEMSTERYRRSGRTTRMLQDVIEVTKTHERVLVVAVDLYSASLQANKLVEMMTQLELPVVYNKARIRVNNIVFVSTRSTNWDWSAFRLEGESKSTPVFIDHYAVERYLREDAWIKKMLELQHKYDLLLTEAQ